MARIAARNTPLPVSLPAVEPKKTSPLAGPAIARAWAPAAANANSASAATQTAEAFYRAFAARDLSTMGASYAPKVQFHDPLFRTLRGKPEVMEMWKTIMPAANPATFKIEPKVAANPTQNADGSWNVKVHWDAHYDLGARHVDNHSDTRLVIKDGKILSQRDDWDLGAWTKQALPVGGGAKAVQTLTSLAAHSFIELEALFEKLSGK